MVTVHLTAADGTRHAIGATSGDSLMRAATAAGIAEIAAICGGCLTCATCHVVVEPDWAARLPPVSADEDAMLETTAVPRSPTSRLSCQITLDPSLDGLAVRLPEQQY
jgi:2Fe-2S ferredoxin